MGIDDLERWCPRGHKMLHFSQTLIFDSAGKEEKGTKYTSFCLTCGYIKDYKEDGKKIERVDSISGPR